MKRIYLILLTGICLGITSCATPPPPRVFNARLYTVDNQEITLRNLKVFEKNYQIESEEFRPRWRQSLELVNLKFDEIAAAQKIDGNITRVRFRDGSEDDFSEFFEDEYNLRGWSEHGPFEINATLVRGLVFLDEKGFPVTGEEYEIPPVIPPPEYIDKFVTFDGDIISGDILADRFKIQTAYGTLFLNRDLIAEIHINREGDDLIEIVNLKNGDIISGFLQPPRLQMKLSDDQVITMNVEQLSRVLFARPVAVEEY